MSARIFSPAKTAMQSGKAKTGHWVLEFDPEMRKKIDPLMGYTTSGDMRSQIRLTFDTQGRGRGLRRKGRACLPCRGAERDQAPPDFLCGEFPL